VIPRADAVTMLGTPDTTRLPAGILIVDDLEEAITTMDKTRSPCDSTNPSAPTGR